MFDRESQFQILYRHPDRHPDRHTYRQTDRQTKVIYLSVIITHYNGNTVHER